MSFSETKCEIFNADEKTKLNVYEWIPKKEIKAVFLAIHGGMTHGGNYVTPALYFMEKGVATYAPDLRWHGTYSKYNPDGKIMFHVDTIDGTVNDIHNLYVWVKDKHPGLPIFILCHSYGGLVCLKYGLTIARNDDIAGFIISSPWLKNIVNVPKVVEVMAKIIAKFNPKFAIKLESLTDFLTHDETITARHYRDEEIGIRGTKATVGLALEAEKAQSWVLDNIKNWEKFPLFVVLAGKDKLAEPQVNKAAFGSVSKDLVKLYFYEDNYHENFNEVNRKEIFINIWNWMEKLIRRFKAKPATVKTKKKSPSRAKR